MRKSMVAVAQAEAQNRSQAFFNLKAPQNYDKTTIQSLIASLKTCRQVWLNGSLTALNLLAPSNAAIVEVATDGDRSAHTWLQSGLVGQQYYRLLNENPSSNVVAMMDLIEGRTPQRPTAKVEESDEEEKVEEGKVEEEKVEKEKDVAGYLKPKDNEPKPFGLKDFDIEEFELPDLNDLP